MPSGWVRLAVLLPGHGAGLGGMGLGVLEAVARVCACFQGCLRGLNEPPGLVAPSLVLPLCAAALLRLLG